MCLTSKNTKARSLIVCLILSYFIMGELRAQSQQPAQPTRKVLLAAARDLIDSTRFCVLITLDEQGQPQARAMDPFPPEEGMVIWFGTNRQSRKVKQIRNDPRVTVFYLDPSGAGYVTIIGTAKLVNDVAEKAKRWKKNWKAYYKDKRESYLLIQVIPNKLEVVNYRQNITGDPVTWRAPVVEFKATETKK
ncbi:MAG: pyridoxamine 5'-phosphate oxidase family protein [bacterium]